MSDVQLIVNGEVVETVKVDPKPGASSADRAGQERDAQRVELDRGPRVQSCSLGQSRWRGAHQPGVRSLERQAALSAAGPRLAGRAAGRADRRSRSAPRRGENGADRILPTFARPADGEATAGRRDRGCRSGGQGRQEAGRRCASKRQTDRHARHSGRIAGRVSQAGAGETARRGAQDL